MEISRNQQNYIAMTVIYNELTHFAYGNEDSFRDARDLMIDMCECSLDEVPSYIKDVVTFALNNYGKIVEAFSPYLKNWTWDRIPLLSRSILLLSYSHKQIEMVDKRILINVAVELAKKYIEPKQAKFINAILDEVL